MCIRDSYNNWETTKIEPILRATRRVDGLAGQLSAMTFEIIFLTTAQ